MVPVDPFDTQALDEAEKLPPRNQLSYITMLVAQGATAFTDNFVKMLIVAFAGAVALDTDIGSSMQIYLAAIFSIPYILFSPVAGWLSDRYSKQQVMFWTLGMQTAAFCLFLGALAIHQAQLTLWLCLVCFFIVATQSAFFSPAKFGILKELIGSRRLGGGSGMMQMLNLTGTLAGMWAGPTWFKNRLEQGDDPWDAVWQPMLIMTGLSLIPMFITLLIQKTPSRKEITFKRKVIWEHIVNLKIIFRDRPIMLAALGVAYFWFLSNAVGSILVTLSHELHPTDKAAAAGAMAMMPAMLGVGIMVGSLIAGIICRKRIELGLVPLSGLMLSASLVVIGGFSWQNIILHAGLVMIGVAGGCFMAPLYAFVQDRAKPSERARVMASLNLMDCLAAFVANLLVVKPMLMLGLSSPVQLLVLAPITLGAALYIMKLLPRSFLHFIVSALVRTFYKIRAHHEPRMPKDGGVLLLPNHISYADALMLGVSVRRHVRFVMLETLYKLKALNWGLKIFGTVPISATRPREAIRTVADALKEGQAVVLFPEGQLTRTGFLNELHKGYEIMARTGDHAKVQPVWLDGLWGSVFSFDGGKFFNKLPKKIRYGVGVWFGEPIEARDASVTRVREALSVLSAEAFAARLGRLSQPAGLQRMAWINAHRILDTSVLHGIHTLHWRLSKDHMMAGSFVDAIAEMRDIKVIFDHDHVSPANRDGVLTLVSANADVSALRGRHLVLYAAGDLADAVVSTDYAAVYDERSGTLISLSVPDPKMSKAEDGNQRGHLQGSLGHVLNGLKVKEDTSGVIVGALGERLDVELQLKGVVLDDEGFLKPHAG